MITHTIDVLTYAGTLIALGFMLAVSILPRPKPEPALPAQPDPIGEFLMASSPGFTAALAGLISAFKDEQNAAVQPLQASVSTLTAQLSTSQAALAAAQAAAVQVDADDTAAVVAATPGAPASAATPVSSATADPSAPSA